MGDFEPLPPFVLSVAKRGSPFVLSEAKSKDALSHGERRFEPESTGGSCGPREDHATAAEGCQFGNMCCGKVCR